MRGLLVLLALIVPLGLLGLGFRFGPKQPDGRPKVWWAVLLLVLIIGSLVGGVITVAVSLRPS